MRITKNAPPVKIKAGMKAQPAISEMKEQAPKTQKAVFSLRTEAGSQVFLAGSFNGWSPSAKALSDKKGDGLYTVTQCLPPGDHEYKFVIDGVWCVDPECTATVPNQYGTFNSVRHVV